VQGRRHATTASHAIRQIGMSPINNIGHHVTDH